MHAGDEYSYAPPSNYQKQITSRAIPLCDLIIGHHPHVVQGYTVISGVPVVYSLGNCVFGGNTRPKDLDALTVQAVLHFTQGALDRIDLHFYPISVTTDARVNNYSPCFLTGADAERVMKKLKDSTGNDPGPFDEEEGAVVSFPVER
jgi:poly-gamma-glutamate synthesis protein (capsule biosynthesis protein)